MKINIYLFFLSFLILYTNQSNAEHNFINPKYNNFYCRVIAIVDGDTIDCIKANDKIRVRLSSIDAPEKGQAYSKIAKKRLSDYIFNKTIIVSSIGKDKYNRYLAEIFLDNKSLSINYLMIYDGLAWSYDKYVNDLAYISANKKAKYLKKGLWADKNPINPEIYRKVKSNSY